MAVECGGSILGTMIRELMEVCKGLSRVAASVCVFNVGFGTKIYQLYPFHGAWEDIRRIREHLGIVLHLEVVQRADVGDLVACE